MVTYAIRNSYYGGFHSAFMAVVPVTTFTQILVINKMVDKRKILLLTTLSLLVLSCSAPIVSVLEQDNQRVRLSQVQRKKARGKKL